MSLPHLATGNFFSRSKTAPAPSCWMIFACEQQSSSLTTDSGLDFDKAIPTHLKGNFCIFKPRPYFWHEIRSSTHREQFGKSRRPSEDI